MLLQVHDVVILSHYVFKLLRGFAPIVLHEVQLTNLANGFEEFVGTACQAVLEEGEPEYLGLFAWLQVLKDFCLEVVVHYVLEVNLLNVVVPGMEHREALGAQLLGPEPFDVFLKEFKVR